METIKGVKAFDKGLKCKGFQFKENETFTHEGELKICNSGFHFCENPLDVLDYYDLCDSEFAEVESVGDAVRHDDDSKVATNKLKIGFKIDLKRFIKLSFEYVWGKSGKSDDQVQVASGDSSQLAASGDSSKLAASGYYSKLAASGDYSKLDISGKDSVGVNIGWYGKIKGIVGTWITLAEYDDNGKCIHVKSAKIDGKKLKADTWYILKNKKFTEA